MNKRKGPTVRLTDQAHILLSEKAEDFSSKGHKITKKDIASEAIFMFVQGEDRDKEIEAYREKHLFASAAVGAVAGIIIGVML
jgi:ElaB/YqjD/DUF883 family membrane-anchored ribosome-binding protein